MAERIDKIKEKLQLEDLKYQVVKDENGLKIIYGTANTEYICNVTYCDWFLLRCIMNDIVNDTSYKVEFNDKFLSFSGLLDARKSKLPNGKPKYERLEHSKNGFWTFYQGTEVVVPDLAYIIKDFCDTESAEALRQILDYEYNNELIPIDNKINYYNTLISSIDNFDFDDKIHALKMLKKLCEDKKSGQYFNAELLQKYYSQVLNSIDLELCDERKVGTNGVEAKQLLKQKQE